jgi:hypothetical protein
MTDSQKLDAILARLDDLTTWQENLSHHVEDLGLAMGALNTRLTNIETCVNRLASRAGVPGVPSIGDSHVPAMPRAAKGKNP